ncbi:MAG: hypothetical protein QOH39_1128 [Verrucomicrobiota bacterium]|jgi:hypothetical protein
MKLQDFDERESADSMRAAASRLDVPLELVKRCKRDGSQAFKGGRVYLKPLAEMIATIEEPDSVPFPIPASKRSKVETIEAFREMLRLAIQCRWLTTDEILKIIGEHVITRLGSKIGTEAGRKVSQAIHNGFGLAVMSLEPASVSDEFLKHSSGEFGRATERGRQKLRRVTRIGGDTSIGETKKNKERTKS